MPNEDTHEGQTTDATNTADVKFSNTCVVTDEDLTLNNACITLSISKHQDGSPSYTFNYYTMETLNQLAKWECPFTRAAGENFKYIRLQELTRELYSELVTKVNDTEGVETHTLKDHEAIQKDEALKKLLISASSTWHVITKNPVPNNTHPTSVITHPASVNTHPAQHNTPAFQNNQSSNWFEKSFKEFLDEVGEDDQLTYLIKLNKELLALYNIIPSSSNDHWNKFTRAIEIPADSLAPTVCYLITLFFIAIYLIIHILVNILGLLLETLIQACVCLAYLNPNIDLKEIKKHAANIIEDFLLIAGFIVITVLIIGSPLAMALQLAMTIITSMGEIVFTMYRGIHNIFRSRNETKIAAFSQDERDRANAAIHKLREEPTDNNDTRFINNAIEKIVKERQSSFKHKYHLTFFGQSRSSGELMKTLTGDEDLSVKHACLKAYLSDHDKNGKKDMTYRIVKALRMQTHDDAAADTTSPAP